MQIILTLGLDSFQKFQSTLTEQDVIEISKKVNTLLSGSDKNYEICGGQQLYKVHEQNLYNDVKASIDLWKNSTHKTKEQSAFIREVQYW